MYPRCRKHHTTEINWQKCFITAYVWSNFQNLQFCGKPFYTFPLFSLISRYFRSGIDIQSDSRNIDKTLNTSGDKIIRIWYAYYLFWKTLHSCLKTTRTFLNVIMFYDKIYTLPLLQVTKLLLRAVPFKKENVKWKRVCNVGVGCQDKF